MDGHLFKPSKVGVKVALHCFHLFGHFDNDKKKIGVLQVTYHSQRILGGQKEVGGEGWV